MREKGGGEIGRGKGWGKQRGDGEREKGRRNEDRKRKRRKEMKKFRISNISTLSHTLFVTPETYVCVKKLARCLYKAVAAKSKNVMIL